MGEYLYNIGELSDVKGTYIETWEIVGQTPKYYKIQRRNIRNERAMNVTTKIAREVVDCSMAVNQYPHQYMYTSQDNMIMAYIAYQEHIVRRAKDSIEEAEEVIKAAKRHKFALDWFGGGGGWESDK